MKKVVFESTCSLTLLCFYSATWKISRKAGLAYLSFHYLFFFFIPHNFMCTLLTLQENKKKIWNSLPQTLQQNKNIWNSLP